MAKLKKHISKVHEKIKNVAIVHDKIKRFKCHICDKSYVASRDLKLHVKSVHEN